MGEGCGVQCWKTCSALASELGVVAKGIKDVRVCFQGCCGGYGAWQCGGRI